MLHSSMLPFNDGSSLSATAVFSLSVTTLSSLSVSASLSISVDTVHSLSFAAVFSSFVPGVISCIAVGNVIGAASSSADVRSSSVSSSVFPMYGPMSFSVMRLKH